MSFPLHHKHKTAFLTTIHKQYDRLRTHSITITSCSLVYKCGSPDSL